jgi:hypothetical protein
MKTWYSRLALVDILPDVPVADETTTTVWADAPAPTAADPASTWVDAAIGECKVVVSCKKMCSSRCLLMISDQDRHCFHLRLGPRCC